MDGAGGGGRLGDLNSAQIALSDARNCITNLQAAVAAVDELYDEDWFRFYDHQRLSRRPCQRALSGGGLSV